MNKVTVIGAGNIGIATAAYLANKGYSICLYTSNNRKYNEIIKSKKLILKGCLNIKTTLDRVSNSIEDSIQDSTTIFFCKPAIYHLEIVKNIARYLTDQTIVLFSGKFAGSLIIEKEILKENPSFKGCVVETTSIFSSRLDSSNSAIIRGFKKKVRFAAICVNKTNRITSEIQNMFAELIPSQDYLERSFCDIGAMLHPAIFINNLDRIKKQEDFLFYMDGLTPEICNIIEELDAERLQVAHLYNYKVPDLTNIIREYYESPGNDLLGVIRNTSPYQISKAPTEIQHRYVLEDVPDGLVPLYQLGLKKGLQLKHTKSLIDKAGKLFNVNFVATGRNLDKSDIPVKELML